MDRCAGHPLAVWMGLCHDLGKVRTEEAILPHHYGHELKGVDLNTLSPFECMSFLFDLKKRLQ